MTDPVLIPVSNECELLKRLAETYGVDCTNVLFQDVFTVDDEMITFLPQPIYAFLFIYPIGNKDGYLEKRHKEGPSPENPPWYTKQTLRNACGTVALIHAIANTPLKDKVKPDSWLGKFFSESEGKTPEERADIMLHDTALHQLHNGNAEESSIEIPADLKIDTHFIAFIVHNGQLWELDGRKGYPISHGPADSPGSALKVVREEFLPHVEDPMRIGLTAICCGN